eukprot:GEMP01043592.1.p1 GENE.GEMP01043592.1~~GEMP01043592.1.p1  ORF type:complete len:427 (+),score=85.99 GEMP01043592.1:123-1403(+)
MFAELKRTAAEFRTKFRPKDLSNWEVQAHEVQARKGNIPQNRVADQYAILMDIPIEQKRDFVASCVKNPELDRAMGCFVGLAVADSLGHFFEFLPACNGKCKEHYYDRKTDTIVNGSNVFELKRGQWTDDCSMALCMADSLLLTEGNYDGSDLRIRFANWWYRGYNNAFRVENREKGTTLLSVGLGGNISRSLYSMNSGEKPLPRFERDTEDAGNGSIMRLAAVPLRFRNTVEALEVASEQSYSTHPGVKAADACRFLAFVVHAALNSSGKETAKEMLDRAAADFVKKCECSGDLARMIAAKEPTTSLEVCWNWRDDIVDVEGAISNRGAKYNDYPVIPDYFGSFCFDGLALALHSVYNTTSFDECIERCINYLGDADSTGAVAGQIAGAFYGYSAIPQKWRDDLVLWDEWDIPTKAALLYLESNP